MPTGSTPPQSSSTRAPATQPRWVARSSPGSRSAPDPSTTQLVEGSDASEASSYRPVAVHFPSVQLIERHSDTTTGPAAAGPGRSDHAPRTATAARPRRSA